MEDLSTRLVVKPAFAKAFIILLYASISSLVVYPQSFTEKFESGIRNDYWATEGLKSVTSSDYSVSGNKSYRSYIPIRVHSNPRCEIRFRGANGTPNWHPHFSTWGVKFAVYIPKDFKPDPTSSEYLAQFHSVPDPRDTYNNPPWALRLRGTKLSVTNRWIEKKIASNAHQHEKTWSLPGNVVPGKWHYFIVDIHWDYRSSGSGFMKFYMKVGSPPSKSDLKINHKGPTGYNDDKGSYFKLGLYKWDWKSQMRVNWSKAAGVRYREVYYDDFEIKKNGFGPAAVTNKPPKANAGPDITINAPTSTANLKGTVSDPENKIDEIQWTQKSGPGGVVIQDDDEAETKVSKLKEGRYAFELKVTDDKGASDTDRMILIVEAPENLPPVAKAGKDITEHLPIQSLKLVGEVSDPEGKIKSIKWTQKSGPSQAKIRDDDEEVATISDLEEGRYAFELAVTDEHGLKDTDRVVVYIEPPKNLPPVAKAGKDITEHLPIQSLKLNGEVSDPEGNIESIKWTQKSGPSQAKIRDADEEVATISDLEEGRYAFELAVTDEHGAKDTDRVVVYIEPPKNLPPVARAGKDITEYLPIQSLKLEGEVSDPEGEISSIKWAQKSGPSQAKIRDADEAVATISDLEEGRYAFELAVTDDHGEKDTDRVVVYIEPPKNLPPVAKAGKDITAYSTVKSLKLEGEVSDPENSIESIKWTQKSGPSQAQISNSDEAIATISDLEEGRYAFELAVIDDQGNKVTDRVVVYIEAPLNEPPVARAGPDINILLPENTVVINGTATDIDDGIESMKWTQKSGPSDADLEGTTTATLTASNLVEGRYAFEFLVTDRSGDKDADRVIVIVGVPDNLPPSANAGPNITLSMPTTSTSINGKGSDKDDGIASYLWSQVSGPSTAQTGDVNQPTLDVSNLEIGRYVFKLEVIDQSGDSDIDQVVVTVVEAQATIAADITNATCNSDNGAIALNITGGRAPFEIKWSNGSTESELKNLKTGTYDVEVTDNLGRLVSKSFEVNSEKVDLAVNSSIKDATCGQDNGSIKVEVSGGVGPYNFDWSNNGRTASLNKLTAGSYTLTISDQNGCSKKVSFEVGTNPGISAFNVNSDVSNTSCSGNDGSIALSIKGYQGSLSFAWDHGATGPKLDQLEAGKYQVTITDENGCFMQSDFVVEQSKSPKVPIVSQLGDSLFVNQKNMQYQWYRDGQVIASATERILRITEAGNYTVAVSNDQSCSTSSDNFVAKDPLAYLVDNAVIKHVEFYPNPAVNDINVRLSLAQPGQMELAIYDLAGRVVLSEQLGVINYQLTHSISVRDLSAGTYLIRAKANDEIVTRRFIKH